VVCICGFFLVFSGFQTLLVFIWLIKIAGPDNFYPDQAFGVAAVFHLLQIFAYLFHISFKSCSFQLPVWMEK